MKERKKLVRENICSLHTGHLRNRTGLPSYRAMFLTSLLMLGAQSISYAQGGQAGLSFLKLGVGARSLGMGETTVAAVNDPSATHYNPAALLFVTDPQILIMHKEWLQGTQTEFLASSFSVESVRLGIFMNATSVPGIEIRQRPGPAEGTFAARNAAIGLSSAYRIDDKFDVGLSLKYLYEKIFVDEAGGIALDVGTVFRSPWDVTFGATLNNVGSMSKLREVSSRLPTTLRIGAARYEALKSLNAHLTFAADIVSILPESNTHLHLGTEFTYNTTFSLRAGYVSGYETRNFTAGAGFSHAFVTVDYAFVPFRFDLGTTHTFSLTLTF